MKIVLKNSSANTKTKITKEDDCVTKQHKYHYILHIHFTNTLFTDTFIIFTKNLMKFWKSMQLWIQLFVKWAHYVNVTIFKVLFNIKYFVKLLLSILKGIIVDYGLSITQYVFKNKKKTKKQSSSFIQRWKLTFNATSFILRIFWFLINFTIVKSLPVLIPLCLHFPDPHHSLHGFDHFLEQFIFLFPLLTLVARLLSDNSFPLGSGVLFDIFDFRLQTHYLISFPFHCHCISPFSFHYSF